MKKLINTILVGTIIFGFIAFGPAFAESIIEFRVAESQQTDGLMEMTVQGSNRRIFVSRDVLLTSADIKSALLKTTEGGVPQIEIVFTESGKFRFAEVTGASIGKPLAIIVNGKLMSAPIVREKITGGRVVIAGAFTEEEASQIVDGLNER